MARDRFGRPVAHPRVYPDYGGRRRKLTRKFEEPPKKAEAVDLQRTLWFSNDMDTRSSDAEEDRYNQDEPGVIKRVEREDEANLVSSLSTDGKTHLPCIDLDLPARLVPSATPGHFHLFIDKPMGWLQYQKLLGILMTSGIITRAYYTHALKRRMSTVRRPGLYKLPPPEQQRPEDKTAVFYAQKADQLWAKTQELENKVAKLEAENNELKSRLADTPRQQMTWM
ncbi:MAG TPA: hypothetical protein VJ742_13390 [Nitrososphaera sp.]|nr:hypothetical protein [Nitrososphaera sp.]